MSCLGSALAAAACVALSAVACGTDGPTNTPTATAPRASATRPAITPSRTVTVPATAPSLEPSSTPPPRTTAVITPTPPPRPPTSPPGGFVAATIIPTDYVTLADLAARGSGSPGRGALSATRIVIPRAEVDAELAAVVVGNDGQMPPPPAADVVAWYDFSMWPGLGGLPGAGGNVVIAGDASRVGVGPGVFWRLNRMVAGDYVRITLNGGGSICYRVEWNKIARFSELAYEDIVAATSAEYLTMITGAQSPDERRIVSARVAPCGAEPTLTPTRTPRAGHHKLKIVAENLKFTIIEGGTVPLGIHTVDYNVDHRDAGVAHTIAFFDTTGRELIASEPVVGPQVAWGGAFGVGPPQPPGTYTFRCAIHPQMTGTLNVLP